MNEKTTEALIPIEVAEDGSQLVDARVLHEFLCVRRDFSTWIKERIGKFGFIDGEDYITFSPDLGKNQRGRPTTDYGLTLDMAKQLCMVENNSKGMEARKYFIECERRAKSQVPQLSTRREILLQLRQVTEMALEQEVELVRLNEVNAIQSEQLTEAKPKVLAYDKLMDADGYATMNRAAKILGIGPNILFDILRTNKILMSNGKDRNVPYQKYIDAGWFVVKVSSYSKEDGSSGASSTTRVTTKGIIKLRENLVKYGYITEDDFFLDMSETEGR